MTLRRPRPGESALGRTAFRLALAVGALAVIVSVTGNTAGAWVSGTNGYIAYTSPEGHSTLYAGSPHIWVIRTDGTNKRQLTSGNDAWPNWSPDGRKIVFSRQTFDGETRAWRIWEMDSNGSAQHPLSPRPAGTDPNRGDNMPRFSPDGSSIVYIETIPNADPSRPPDSQIWVMNADGSDPHRLTDLAPTHVYAVGWSPDGAHILFISDELSGFCSTVSSACRTFNEMSPTGADLAALPLYTTGVPGSGWGYWDSFDFAAGHLAWGDATYLPDGSNPMPQEYRIFTATGTSAVTGTSTELLGDHPSFAPDAATTGELAFAGCPGNSFLASGCTYQIQTGTLGGAYGQSRQLTFDASSHYSPAWGPTPPPAALLLKPRPLSFGNAPQAGSPLVINVLCPQSAGSGGCHELLQVLKSGGGHVASLQFTSKAGAVRSVSVKFNGGVRADTTITVQLRTTIGSHSSLTRLASRVLEPASITTQCPGQPTQPGAPVALSGTLRDSAPAGQRIVVIATTPDGRTVSVAGTTSKGGAFVAKVTPDAPGPWELHATWAGDAKHSFTSSGGCPLSVPAPAAAKTALSIVCPAQASYGDALPITGALDPAFSGARITLEYSHPRKGLPTEKFTTAVTTSTKGTYSDGSVAADDPGEWDITAFYDGDAADTASTSTTCAITVG